METKQQLMAAALRLISERGYENVTIDDIAAATNNTKGAVYHYFSSKQELYGEALEYLAGRLTSLAAFEMDADRPLSESIKKLLTALIAGDATTAVGLPSADIYYLMFDGMRRFPAIKERFQALNRDYLREVARRVQAGGTDRSGTIEALQVLVWIEGINLIQAMTGGLIGRDDIDTMVDRFFA